MDRRKDGCVMREGAQRGKHSVAPVRVSALLVSYCFKNFDDAPVEVFNIAAV